MVYIMKKNMLKIILRKSLCFIKFCGRRRFVLLLPLLLLFLVVMWPTIWWSMALREEVQEPPRTELPLEYEMNRNIQQDLQNIQVLIEPTNMLCDTLHEVPVLVMVACTPSHTDLRVAVRETWAIFQPTFFVMGLNIGDRSKATGINHIEAATYGDILVFNFLEHHLNQTLKTALMMKWSMEQCPQAQFLFKTEEDVMVNPWTLSKVLEQHANAQLIGYSLNNTHSLRSEHKQSYMQKLPREDGSLKYLSGTGYIIRTEYIRFILEKAYNVPMITREDVYFTYLVAHKELGLTLTHDRRLSPYKPWLQISCVYWNQASIHRLSPIEMLNAWYLLEDMVISTMNVGGICKYFNKWFYAFSEKFLY